MSIVLKKIEALICCHNTNMGNVMIVIVWRQKEGHDHVCHINTNKQQHYFVYQITLKKYLKNETDIYSRIDAQLTLLYLVMINNIT